MRFNILAGAGQITFPIYKVPVTGGVQPAELATMSDIIVAIDGVTIPHDATGKCLTALYSDVAEGRHIITVAFAIEERSYVIEYVVRAEIAVYPAVITAPNAYVSLYPETPESIYDTQLSETSKNALQNKVITAVIGTTDLHTLRTEAKTIVGAINEIAPHNEGAQGDMLQLNENGEPVWATPAAGTTLDEVPTENSNNGVKSGGVWAYAGALGVFDISAYHATGGVLAKYADLAAALDSNNGGGVPQSLQKGGISVKFVQSSDNKYVQYQYLGTEVTGTPNPFYQVANWICTTIFTDRNNIIIGNDIILPSVGFESAIKGKGISVSSVFINCNPNYIYRISLMNTWDAVYQNYLLRVRAYNSDTVIDTLLEIPYTDSLKSFYDIKTPSNCNKIAIAIHAQVGQFAKLNIENITDKTRSISGLFNSFTNGTIVASSGAEGLSSSTKFQKSDAVDVSAYAKKKLIYKSYQYQLTNGNESTSGIAFYDSSNTYINGEVCLYGTPDVVWRIITVPSNAKYMRVTYLQDATTFGYFEAFVNPDESLLSLIKDVAPIYNYNRALRNTQKITFPTKYIHNSFVENNDDVITVPATNGTGTCLLRMAYNYSHNKKRTPLIVFFGGTNSFNNYTDSEFSEIADYVDYLCKEGYNVMTPYAWMNDINGVNFPSPFSLSNFVKAYQYIIENYNIEKDGIYVYCRSYGCTNALSFAYNSGIKIKALAIQSGSIGMAARASASYTDKFKKYIFDDDANYAFSQQYISDNYRKLAPYENMVLGLMNVSQSDMVAAILSRNCSDLGSDVKRHQPFPSKIWCADDDTSISPENLKAWMQSVSLANGLCEYRQMPSNYTDEYVITANPHHICDTAGPTEDVTTILGYTVERVPVAYVEMIDFFRRFG